jgi:hypothetical protein
MSKARHPVFAWEPFTPRGVATFARARLGRLLFVQIVIALLGAASAVWFLKDSVFPAISAAIQNLPDSGEIRSGQLEWPDETPKLLVERRFLALDVDLEHGEKINSTADVQIEFGKKTVSVSSLFGYAEMDYPPGKIFSFNRPELEPLWGAWQAEILFIAGIAVTVSLLVIWWLLATLYFLPAWLLGFFANRDLSLLASWRLSAAALLPGALLMAAGIFLYDFGVMGLVQFAFICGAHFVLGWIYLFVSLLFLPEISTGRRKGNPFA